MPSTSANGTDTAHAQEAAAVSRRAQNAANAIAIASMSLLLVAAGLSTYISYLGWSRYTGECESSNIPSTRDFAGPDTFSGYHQTGWEHLAHSCQKMPSTDVDMMWCLLQLALRFSVRGLRDIP